MNATTSPQRRNPPMFAWLVSASRSCSMSRSRPRLLLQRPDGSRFATCVNSPSCSLSTIFSTAGSGAPSAHRSYPAEDSPPPSRSPPYLRVACLAASSESRRSDPTSHAPLQPPARCDCTFRPVPPLPSKRWCAAPERCVRAAAAPALAHLVMIETRAPADGIFARDLLERVPLEAAVRLQGTAARRIATPSRCRLTPAAGRGRVGRAARPSARRPRARPRRG